MKSHAYGLRQSAAVLDRAAVTPVPSSKHRPACRPLQQSSAERAWADKGHTAGTLGCGGLTWARLTWILREIVAAPTLDVIKGLMLFTVLNPLILQPGRLRDLSGQQV